MKEKFQATWTVFQLAANHSTKLQLSKESKVSKKMKFHVEIGIHAIGILKLNTMATQEHSNLWSR